MYIVSKNCKEFPAENCVLGVFDQKKYAIRAIQLYTKKHYGNVNIEEVVALPNFKKYNIKVDDEYIITFTVESYDINYMKDVGGVVDDDDLNVGRNAKEGLYNGEPTYCPVDACDCPYHDHYGICHIDDPMEDCTDWAECYDSWKDWLACNNITEDEDEDEEYDEEDEIKWAGDVYGYEDTMEDNEE